MPLLQTFLIAMTPIGELRAAIPFGIAHHINPLIVYVVAVIGNMVPVFFLIPFFNFLEQMVMQTALKTAEKSPVKKTNPAISMVLSLYKKWRDQTHRLHSRRFERIGACALIFFVAIPLPLTGAWSGALAAVIFDIPIKKSAPLIFAGVLIAGLIVGAVSVRLF
jgi:uncharacterized membrane protein